MQPQLIAIVAELELAQEKLHRVASNTSPERWNRRAHPDRWSVAECIAHLNLTSTAYIPLLRNALDDPRWTSKPAPRLYRRDLMGWIVSLSAGPLPIFGGVRFGRVKTVPAFVPGSDLDPATTVAQFDRLQAELVEIARSAAGRPLEHMKIVSPFDTRISYNAYSALVILPRHQQRHLWQAEHVWDAAA